MTTSETHCYDAATAPRGMLKHILPVFGFPAVVATNTTILANFFRRDLFGRFRGSFLGIFWVLIQPIFLFAIYFTVFGFLFAPRAWGTDLSPRVEFAMYLFTGIIAFSSFIEATTRSCNVVMENGNLVKKVAFPCELLPIPAVLVATIVYLVGAVVVLSVGIPLDELRVSTDLLAWPLVVLVHMTMCLGFGFILATLQVLMRDTTHLWGILSQAWFFLSPVFWFYPMLEEKLGVAVWFFELNPMYPLVQAHRMALGYGPGELVEGKLVGGHHQMHHIKFDAKGEPVLNEWGGPMIGEPLPDVWHHLGFAAIWAVGIFVFGYAFFMSRKNKFSDLV